MKDSRTALVTGASRGIGKAVVMELVQRGVRVFATGRDLSLLEALSAQSGCAFSCRDISSSEEVLKLYEEAKKHFGSAPDILVNNAGFNHKSPLVEASIEEFDLQFAVNLRAPFLLCRETGRDMRTRGSGHIVNVISTCALFANENVGVYTAMKAGLRDLTKVLAKELRAAGVKVTAVYPGGVDTDFRQNDRPDYLRPETAGKLIADTLFAPEDAVIHDLVFRPMVETNF
jgi:NAD(P)-dependent dehydrogenase (short-subunit alcohol dehydrogenase family)